MMEKVKIGKFIAVCRRNKNITQEQFAEILGVTGKSVSKWENGVCLPDASLYEPLCAVLEISINELFAGHRIREEDYKKAAKENLMQMLKYKLYRISGDDIAFQEFDHALTEISELVAQMKAFPTKQEAVDYLVAQTQEPYETCASAYDFYIGLFTFEEDES